MAVKTCGKFDKMFNMMNEQKLKGNFLDQLLCRKCKNILINACQAGCGCRFCRHCIDELVQSGCQICPGGTDDCKDENLSEVATDHIVNKTISKCVVECPNETCQHECQLIDMVEHLSSCSKTSTKCLFHNYGCQVDHLRGGGSSYGLRKDISNHNLILIEMIGNVKNELEMVKQSYKMNEKKLSEEIRLIKEEKEDLAQQFEMFKLNSSLGDEGDVMNVGNTNSRLALIEIQQTELMKQFEVLKLDYSQQCSGNVDRWVTDVNDETMKTEIAAKMKESEKWLDKIIDGIFLWKIFEISDKRMNGCSIYSSTFCSKMGHTFRLGLATISASNEMIVYLYVSPGCNDHNLSWPLYAAFRITITNRAIPNGGRTVIKNLKIFNTFELVKNNKFKFHFSDLSRCGLLNGNCFIIECSVD